MKKTLFLLISTLISATLFTACSTTVPKPNEADKISQMSKEEMLKLWERSGQVNENHKLLSSWAGKWKTEVTTWMPGSDKPVKSKGYSVITPILGGRFVEEKYFGTFHGKKFEGRGIFGYDNHKAVFSSTWLDNTSTSVMTSTGKKDGDTITWNGEFTCPITNQTKSAKSVTKIVSPKEHAFEMWDVEKNSETGKVTENKVFEIRYTK